MDVLKKVQKAGKNLHISIPCDEVETALECLSSTGLFIDTRCETEEEARTLLHLAEKWSRA
jgi:sulfopyruvate decarboxylase TPP-binding subunit